MSDYKPITGELRKYATVSWDPWPDARDRLYQMCDRIDAIHAGLERENAELKAELDRVLGEQEEHAHARGESITNELREWASVEVPYKYGHQLSAIADRIDAEHERQLEVLYRDMSDAEYVKLPKDADGEPIHIGDVLQWPEDGDTFEVIGIGEDGVLFYFDPDTEGETADWTASQNKRHYHAPTVEDVLREFALKVAGEECMTMRTGVVEEYAAKLQLAGDAE